MTRLVYNNIDEYIDSFSDEVQNILKKLRQNIIKAAPELTEGISYGIPTFYLNGKYLVYLAGFKKHVSVYPATTEAVEKSGLAKYRVSKGTLRFPMDKEIPYNQIKKFVKERVKESFSKQRVLK